MRRFIAIILVAMVAAFPFATCAQQAAPQPAPDAMGLGSGKALAVGAGILLGVLIVSTPMAVRGTTLLGALAGGILASWWYNEHAAALALDPTKKAP